MKLKDDCSLTLSSSKQSFFVHSLKSQNGYCCMVSLLDNNLVLELWLCNYNHHIKSFVSMPNSELYYGYCVTMLSPHNEKRFLTSWRSETDPSSEDFVAVITSQSVLKRDQ